MRRHTLAGLLLVCLAAGNGVQEPSDKGADDPEVRPPVTKTCTTCTRDTPISFSQTPFRMSSTY